jgi:hypothetical protein
MLDRCTGSRLPWRLLLKWRSGAGGVQGEGAMARLDLVYVLAR